MLALFQVSGCHFQPQTSRQDCGFRQKHTVVQLSNDHCVQWREVSRYSSQQVSDRPTVTDGEEETPMPDIPDDVDCRPRVSEFSASILPYGSASHSHHLAPSPMVLQSQNAYENSSFIVVGSCGNDPEVSHSLA